MVRITHDATGRTGDYSPRDAAARLSSYKKSVGSLDGLTIETNGINLALHNPAVPEWVSNFLTLVEEKHGQRITELRWRSANKQYSTGTTWKRGRIAITVGNDKYDLMAVLLHEYAHTIVFEDGHGRDFYRWCFKLFHEFLPDDYVMTAVHREWEYKKFSRYYYYEVYEPERIRPTTAIDSIFA